MQNRTSGGGREGRGGEGRVPEQTTSLRYDAQQAQVVGTVVNSRGGDVDLIIVEERL